MKQSTRLLMRGLKKLRDRAPSRADQARAIKNARRVGSYPQKTSREFVKAMAGKLK